MICKWFGSVFSGFLFKHRLLFFGLAYVLVIIWEERIHSRDPNLVWGILTPPQLLQLHCTLNSTAPILSYGFMVINTLVLKKCHTTQQ